MIEFCIIALKKTMNPYDYKASYFVFVFFFFNIKK